jgi:hypothetical protein
MEDNFKIGKIDYNSRLLHLNHCKLNSFLNYLEYIFSKKKNQTIIIMII